MPITIADPGFSTQIVVVAVLAALLLSLRKTRHTALLPIAATQELKGLGILAIVFAHIAYMLVTDSQFLYPLSVAAGVGVDLFLFMSGFGLTSGALKKPLPPLAFYQRRLVKVFIPFWVVLIVLFAVDALVHGRFYGAGYMLQSFLGLFPRASAFEDVNSPFWYISWMLLFYLLFPLTFMRARPWLSALVLAVIANAIAVPDWFGLQANWLHRLHTVAFSLGMVAAWALQACPQATRRLEDFRNAPGGVTRYLLIAGGLLLAGYMASHNSAGHWPAFTAWLEGAGIRAGFFIGQLTSITAMVALLVVFAFKRLDNGFLNLFGVYSYETYLLHWPLMARYDVFYQYLPAWAATLAWLAAFIGVGWVLQRITTPIGAWVDGLGQAR